MLPNVSALLNGQKNINLSGDILQSGLQPSAELDVGHDLDLFGANTALAGSGDQGQAAVPRAVSPAGAIASSPGTPGNLAGAVGLENARNSVPGASSATTINNPGTTTSTLGATLSSTGSPATLTNTLTTTKSLIGG